MNQTNNLFMWINQLQQMPGLLIVVGIVVAITIGLFMIKYVFSDDEQHQGGGQTPSSPVGKRVRDVDALEMGVGVALGSAAGLSYISTADLDDDFLTMQALFDNDHRMHGSGIAVVSIGGGMGLDECGDICIDTLGLGDDTHSFDDSFSSFDDSFSSMDDGW